MSAARDNWDKTIVCYYTNWSQYRKLSQTQNANFFPENLNTSLCTHLMFAFAKVVELENNEWGLSNTELGFQ